MVGCGSGTIHWHTDKLRADPFQASLSGLLMRWLVSVNSGSAGMQKQAGKEGSFGEEPFAKSAGEKSVAWFY